MTVDWGGLLGLIGPVSIVIALIVLGLLSKRLGSVVRMPRYYLWFYVAGFLMAVSILARLLNIGRGEVLAAQLGSSPIDVLLYVGFPAVATTIGVIVAWRYWSWLLAERG